MAKRKAHKQFISMARIMWFCPRRYVDPMDVETVKDESIRPGLDTPLPYSQVQPVSPVWSFKVREEAENGD